MGKEDVSQNGCLTVVGRLTGGRNEKIPNFQAEVNNAKHHKMPVC